MMPKLKLSLFVHSGNAGPALSRLYKALEFHAYTDYELSIIDVDKDSIRARSHGITETPTLISHTDQGDITFSGDLGDLQKVRQTFGFKSL